MSRSVDVLLDEILVALDIVRRYTDGLTFDGFVADVEKQDAVFRRFEIIGAAVKGVPAEFRAKHPTFRGATSPAPATRNVEG